MADPFIGKYLDDRYEILDVLGVGGMAVVYKARCHRLNRLVAVKILKEECSNDPELRRRFHDESQAVAMLSHPNIVSVYDVSQVDGREFIVMELIDGITLKQYMKKRGGSLNWREALHFMTQILQGLRHAHSRGLIHRDIKPQNIMVLRDGSVKVADFGIARSTNSQSTLTQEAIGSVHYISPEQARGGPVDARTDIYSAGVVLYEMLTGRLPFEGDNPVNVALQHINSIPIAPRELNPDIPLGMEQITMKAMCASLDRRYASADAFLADLEEFRKNPAIDFGYLAPGAVEEALEDEPTMVLHHAEGYTDSVGSRSYPPREPASRRAPAAHFERDAEEEEEEDWSRYTRPTEQERKKRTMMIAGGIGGGVLVLILLIWILWATIFSRLFVKSETYTVPNVVGQTIEQAEQMIADDETIAGHFTIRCESYRADDTAEAGVILEQTPNAQNTTHQETTEIAVVVSSGPDETKDQIVLEDYAGKDYRLVKSNLESLLLVCDLQYDYSDDVEEGLVISTNPGAGANVKVGDTITVTYSLGKKTENVTMVSLLNMLEEDAKKNIETLGLKIGSVDSEYSDTYDEGRVCYQSIAANTTVEAGTTVNITISLGPEPTPDPEPEPDPEPDDPAVKNYKITVPLPHEEGRTEPYTVVIVIDGNTFTQSVAATKDKYEMMYNGIGVLNSVTVDGEDYFMPTTIASVNS